MIKPENLKNSEKTSKEWKIKTKCISKLYHSGWWRSKRHPGRWVYFDPGSHWPIPQWPVSLWVLPKAVASGNNRTWTKIQNSTFLSGENTGKKREDGKTKHAGTHRDSGMVRRSAGDHEHAPATFNLRHILLHSSENNFLLIKQHAAPHRVEHGLGLLENLLLHEILKVALHNLLQLQAQRRDLTGNGLVAVQRPFHAVNGEPCAWQNKKHESTQNRQTNQSINQWTKREIRRAQSINQSINQSIKGYESINQSNEKSMDKWINRSINRSIGGLILFLIQMKRFFIIFQCPLIHGRSDINHFKWSVKSCSEISQHNSARSFLTVWHVDCYPYLLRM